MYYCPQCNKEISGAEVVQKKYVSVEACLHCNTVVQIEEGFSWKQRDAMIMDDDACICEWLESIEKAANATVSRKDDNSFLLWRVSHGTSDLLVRYDKDVNGIIYIATEVPIGNEALEVHRDAIRGIAHGFGLQPHGVSTHGTHGNKAWYGAGCFLSTASLDVPLWIGMLTRLKEATRAISERIGV